MAATPRSIMTAKFIPNLLKLLKEIKNEE